MRNLSIIWLEATEDTPISKALIEPLRKRLSVDSGSPYFVLSDQTGDYLIQADLGLPARDCVVPCPGPHHLARAIRPCAPIHNNIRTGFFLILLNDLSKWTRIPGRN